MKLRANFAKILLLSCVSLSVYAQPPLNIVCAKNMVINYYTSGEYEQDVQQVVEKAEKFLYKRINDNNLAGHPQKLAMVLDIDDTSLSNFAVNQDDDFSNINALIEKRYAKANSPAVKPVLRLYNEALANRVSIFFITMRPKAVESYTVTNLQNEGYTKWSALYLPSPEEAKQGSRAYKSGIRKMLTEQGYTIILNLGDQDSDLDGGYAEYIAKIPNPMYTSAATCEKNGVKCA